MPKEWASSGVEELRARWHEVERRQRDFLARLTDADLDEPVSYRTMNREPHQNPVWQMLRHVVNHSTYHRGQVTTMLRQLGADALSTDLILFYRTDGGESG